MIRDNKKKVKRKTITAIFMEYARTIAISFGCALVFTILLSLHARSEMIKNLYVNPEEQLKMDEKVAKQIVTQSDLTKDLRTKKYAVCLQVGNLYATANDFFNAEYAYKLAIEKAKTGVYTPYLRLIEVYAEQEKFDEAIEVLKSIKDLQTKPLIKFKTRAYIVLGDKYYSVGKFLSAAKCYEKADFYYDKFSKKDKEVEKSINVRAANAYIETANIMVKNGYNSDAVRFLKKAAEYSPDNYEIEYKLAIVYSDLDPIQSVKYFEPLLNEIPQYIDYGVYSKALMKAANIADLEGKPALAKYYRYKIHSIDIFVDNKVIYKNDIEIQLDSFIVRKLWFKYKLRAQYKLKNISNNDIKHLKADFVLRQKDRIRETKTITYANPKSPLYSNGGETPDMEIVFGKNIFTKKELEQYVIDIYLYKDEKYKTLAGTMKVPLKSIYSSK